MVEVVWIIGILSENVIADTGIQSIWKTWTSTLIEPIWALNQLTEDLQQRPVDNLLCAGAPANLTSSLKQKTEPNGEKSSMNASHIHDLTEAP